MTSVYHANRRNNNTCNMHTKEKENSGTCCQIKVNEEPGPEPKKCFTAFTRRYETTNEIRR